MALSISCWRSKHAPTVKVGDALPDDVAKGNTEPYRRVLGNYGFTITGSDKKVIAQDFGFFDADEARKGADDWLHRRANA